MTYEILTYPRDEDHEESDEEDDQTGCEEEEPMSVVQAISRGLGRVRGREEGRRRHCCNSQTSRTAQQQIYHPT